HDDFSHWRRKGCDTFGPVGPRIDTDVEPHHLDIITRVNGVVEDQGNTKDMVHNCYEIVSNISQYVTLHPGALITTGAPGLTRPMKPGEVVEIEIPEIGILRNEIVLDTR
ncbi:MAG: fumarylacetoacetate hydrolase family protein, partial [Chloroflexota bacterium]